MKKTIALVLVILMVGCLMAGCGQKAPSAPQPDSGSSTPSQPSTPSNNEPAAPADAQEPVDLGKPVSLTLGHLYTTTDYRGVAIDYMASRISELSGGNITITVYPSQTLTTSQDALKSVAAGVADMAMGALSFNVSEVPSLAGCDIAGIYDPNYMEETYAKVNPVLDKILATQNQKLLWYSDESNTIFYLNEKNKKEVHSPDDVKGLRLRDHGLWIGKSITTWGASPMTIMPADLTVALERGTVDGGYTGWSFVQTFRCHEVAPYISYTEIGKSCFSPLTINLDVWNSLTEGQQNIILQAMEEGYAIAEDELEKSFTVFEDEVAAAGGFIYYLTPEENQAFVDAAKPLIQQAYESTDDLGRELIDAFLSAPSNYR